MDIKNLLFYLTNSSTNFAVKLAIFQVLCVLLLRKILKFLFVYTNHIHFKRAPPKHISKRKTSCNINQMRFIYKCHDCFQKPIFATKAPQPVLCRFFFQIQKNKLRNFRLKNHRYTDNELYISCLNRISYCCFFVVTKNV